MSILDLIKRLNCAVQRQLEAGFVICLTKFYHYLYQTKDYAKFNL